MRVITAAPDACMLPIGTVVTFRASFGAAAQIVIEAILPPLKRGDSFEFTRAHAVILLICMAAILSTSALA